MSVVNLLCSSCRNIHPKESDGSHGKDSLADIFGDYDLQKVHPNARAMFFGMVLPTLLENLQLFGGCSACMNSVKRVIQSG